jgi:hypothetical protein
MQANRMPRHHSEWAPLRVAQTATPAEAASASHTYNTAAPGNPGNISGLCAKPRELDWTGSADPGKTAREPDWPETCYTAL